MRYMRRERRKKEKNMNERDEDEKVKRRHHTPHPRDPRSFIKKLPEVLRVRDERKKCEEWIEVLDDVKREVKEKVK